MELWIRSQNRELLSKVNALRIEKGEEYDDIEEGFDIVDETYRYGRYKTKERALEVLGDIQKYINSDVMINLNVYQMPKE